jgi:hypothetical protein
VALSPGVTVKISRWRKGPNFHPSASEPKYRKIFRIFDYPLGVAMRLKRMYHQCAEECETFAKKGIHDDARR